MDELYNKTAELLKSLLSIKTGASKDLMVPALKSPSMSLPKPSIKQPSANKIPSGLPPPSKKDPKKMAEQLKNPNPEKVKIEVLKVEANGQWSLVKARPDRATRCDVCGNRSEDLRDGMCADCDSTNFSEEEHMMGNQAPDNENGPTNAAAVIPQYQFQDVKHLPSTPKQAGFHEYSVSHKGVPLGNVVVHHNGGIGGNLDWERHPHAVDQLKVNHAALKRPLNIGMN